MSDELVGIPLGAGIDRASDEYLLRPPAVYRAHNVRLSSRGSYEKRPGAKFNGIVNVGTQSYATAVRKGRLEDEVIVYGSAGGTVLSTEGTHNLDFGALVPTEVITHAAWTPQGVVCSTNVAHNRGFTAVAATVATDPTRITVDNAQSAVAELAIFDSDWRCVWGPHRVPELAWFVRVEPVMDAGLPGFLFLGMQDPSPDADGGAEADVMDLYGMFISAATLLPPSPGLITSNVLGGGADRLNILPKQGRWAIYDTHATNTDRVYVAFYTSAGGGLADFVYGSVDTALVLTSGTKEGISTTDIGDMAVWYDHVTDTVLAYAQHGPSLYYAAGDMTGQVEVAGPVLNDRPVFYRDSSGAVRLTNRQISITGAGPGTPAISGTDTFVRSLHRRPQPHHGRGVLYTRIATDNSAVLTGVQGGTEIQCLDTVDSSSYQHTVVALNNTRLPETHRDNFYICKTPSIHHHIGEVGQTTLMADGSLLVPQAIATPVYLADQKHPWLVGDDETAGPTSRHHGQTRIVVNQVKLDVVASSSIPLHGSTLIAAGNLHVFDGKVSFEPCVEEIRTGFDSSGADTYEIPSGNQITLATNEGIGFKLIYVYTDANGVKYRSEPNAQMITLENTGPSTKTYSVLFRPMFHASHTPQLYQGEGWALEVYVSEIYEVPGTPVGHAWAGTLPVVWDAANNEWIADGTNLMRPSDIINPVAPYTESELPNVRPPSLSVLAKAGSYIFGIAYENPYEIWHTKPLADFIGPEFNPNLILYAPAESGGVVSLAGVGDRLLVLCRHGIWELFVANGPDAAGDGAFPDFRKLWSGDGCVSHNWTVPDTPFGVAFLSASGPKLVTASGQVVDIGKQIKGLYDHTKARCAAYDPANKEIWFFHTDPTKTDGLVYDCQAEQWTTTSFDARAAFILDGAFTRITSLHRIHSHDENELDDGGESFYARITTGWLTFGLTQGLFRVVSTATLIRHIAGAQGTLNISAEYDYTTGTVDSRSWLASEYTAYERVGQFAMKPSRQKLDAVRLTVSDSDESIQQSDRNAIRWALAGLTLRVRTRTRGHVKLQQEAKK